MGPGGRRVPQGQCGPDRRRHGLQAAGEVRAALDSDGVRRPRIRSTASRTAGREERFRPRPGRHRVRGHAARHPHHLHGGHFPARGVQHRRAAAEGRARPRRQERRPGPSGSAERRVAAARTQPADRSAGSPDRARPAGLHQRRLSLAQAELEAAGGFAARPHGGGHGCHVGPGTSGRFAAGRARRARDSGGAQSGQGGRHPARDRRRDGQRQCRGRAGRSQPARRCQEARANSCSKPSPGFMSS